MKFQDKLITRYQSIKGSLCVGLDPVLENLPTEFKKSPESMVAFCKNIIEATQQYACAFKLNSAFFEVYGAAGFEWMREILAAIPPEIVTIWDAKRGDIGNTSKAYAQAAFEYLKADSITLSPYMGSDSLKPFLEYSDKGCFVLCLTSNPGSVDFQTPDLYLKVAQKVQAWNQHQNCGLVVGATQATQMRAVREVFQEGPLLIPGVGAQGGDLAQSLKLGRGRGPLAIALINASRSIIFASKGHDYLEKAARAAEDLWRQCHAESALLGDVDAGAATAAGSSSAF
jgi:orotidine-5'-phosphate decarboxylase